MAVKQIHRAANGTDIYFVANTARTAGTAECSFKVAGKQPELWDPVTGTMRNLPQFAEANGSITIPLQFDSSQGFFIVFRKESSKESQGVNFSAAKEVTTLRGGWQVKFDTLWVDQSAL